MSINQKLDSVILGATPIQAQELVNLTSHFNYLKPKPLSANTQPLESLEPNTEINQTSQISSLQLEIINQIRYQQAQELIYEEKLKKASQKILKVLEKITHNFQEYPLGRLDTLNQIISSKEISENKENILQIIEFLFPEHIDLLISLFENLQEIENLDPNQIQILGFTPLSQEDFPVPKANTHPVPNPVPNPTPTLRPKTEAKPYPIPKKPKTEAEIEPESNINQKKFEAYLKEYIWLLFMLTAIISFKIYWDKSSKCVSINPDQLNQSTITRLLNNHSIPSKEYIESFQPESNHLKLHLNLKYIEKKLNDEIIRMQKISDYPLEVRINFIDQITHELVYTTQPIYTIITPNQRLTYHITQKIYLYQLEVNAVGFSFRKSSTSAFIPTDISIHNPITPNNFQEQYLVDRTQKFQDIIHGLKSSLQ